MNKSELSRRAFLASATATAIMAGCATRPNTAQVVPGKRSPNEKLNIGAIGVGGMGRANIDACSTENIVALCDVDDARAGDTYKAYPNARRHRDFRKMLEAEAKNIDAVIVATPDHTHAAAAMAAMRLGKHVYCQKPLAHSVYEVQTLMKTAQECKVQTQMGNQGHSSDSIRRLYEWIEDGAVGPIREVHAWSDRPVGGDPWSTFPVMKRPAETPPVPDTLDWDLWLGPAKYRPYHPIYCPLTWRGWWDFGTGPLGDMGCHILDPAFWGLKLGHPVSVEATTTHWEKEVSEETYPRAAIIRYQFPARGKMPPVALTWYDGRLLPPIPRDFAPNQRFDSNGALLVGEKGTILHGSHGAGGLKLLPRELMRDYKQPPKTIPRVKDCQGAHEQDWIRACKDGNPASSNFEYGGALTTMVLLGVLAMRLKDRKLDWDGAALRFTNDEEANQLLNPPYREGWTL
ncbi:MAG TPA: Gfo/Idh/MocA family oxidoreductase [Candidatus Hydrogenedentes bacterium]|nr:Gfo/Idh/MocA family oxidoreductase [Candidatus Hydrogenedentota bacterium]